MQTSTQVSLRGVLLGSKSGEVVGSRGAVLLLPLLSPVIQNQQRSQLAPSETFKVLMTFQSCPELRWGGWVFLPQCWPVTGYGRYGLPWVRSLFIQGNGRGWQLIASGIHCSWGNTSFSPRGGEASGQHISVHYLHLNCSEVGEGKTNYLHVVMAERSHRIEHMVFGVVVFVFITKSRENYFYIIVQGLEEWLPFHKNHRLLETLLTVFLVRIGFL